jgi:acyl-[acyl-carrier-protein]-phospholipid O-acyltransferase / long-chain-fatty-acid--[acyl-carrier-protein] ligase
MTPLRHFTGAVPFFLAVFLNAFIDLGHKIAIQNTVFKLYDGPQQIVLTALVNALILLPFILLLSPAGFVSDKYRKTHVMQISAWARVVFTALITVFYYLGWFWAAFAMTFLLAAQSAMYSPAKYGFIKQLFGKERLGEANGVVAALSIVAILAGIFVYSVLFEASLHGHTDIDSEAKVLQAIAPVGFLLILSAVIELVMTYRLPAQPATGVETTFPMARYFTGRLFKEDVQPLVKSQVIRLSVIGLATFWGVGQVMLAAFPAFYKETLLNDNTILVQGILACSGIGIALGSMISGRYSRNYIETGLLPLGAIGIALGLWLLPNLSSGWAFALDFLFIGIAGGVFIVPLNALIQFNAQEHELGKTLAANNWVQNLVMLSFLVITVLFAYQGWSSKNLLQLIGAVAIVGCVYVIYHLPQSLARFALSYLLSRRYHVSVQGMKNIPAEGGVLLLGNHISWIDWAVVQIATPRPVRFVMARSIYQLWYLKWFCDLFGVIPIESGVRSRKALDEVSAALNRGEVVCLFPEGAISRTGHLGDFRPGYERACADVNDDVVILPFYLRGLWGSQFSRSSARMKTTSSSILARDIVVAFGKPLAKTTTADVLKRRVFDLSISSWQTHIDSLPTISRTWIRSAKKTGSGLAIVDTALDRRLSGYQALTGSLLIADQLRGKTAEQNIAVLLPTSAAGALVNMAILVAGKTVINLNYTASGESIQNAMTQAQIKTVITSTRFMSKLAQRGIDLSDALAQLDVVDIETLLKNISMSKKIGTTLIVRLLPAWLLQMVYARSKDANSTAAILFSSGSEGMPKGVMLSHKNILANVKQTAEVLNMEDNDAIIANLPLFHAFGLTITQFLPLLEGCPMICHPDPTDSAGCAKAIAREKATIMFGTSTFLRLYCRSNKVHPLMLDSLRIVVAGAEKLSDDVRNAFQQKFNIPLYEGYGATETTPVASVNLPNKLETQAFHVQRGNKPGSVGMPLPGTSCMIVDPETFAELPTGEAGMVVIGGAQVMQGYLNNPEKTAAVIREFDGGRWYITGDKGYIDSDGYLFIVDRYSRFAKIGGEMVSLGAVERHIQTLFNDPNREVVVVAIEDAKKGERLVALYTGELDVESFKKALQAAGLTPLAIPSDWIVVEAVPKLGSGKIDFGTAKKLALAATQ